MSRQMVSSQGADSPNDNSSLIDTSTPRQNSKSKGRMKRLSSDQQVNDFHFQKAKLRLGKLGGSNDDKNPPGSQLNVVDEEIPLEMLEIGKQNEKKDVDGATDFFKYQNSESNSSKNQLNNGTINQSTHRISTHFQ